MTVRNDRKLSVEVASVPDREGLVAEVWFDDQLLAELRLDASGVRIQIYPADAAQPWDVPCDELLAALQTARTKLVALPPASPSR